MKVELTKEWCMNMAKIEARAAGDDSQIDRIAICRCGVCEPGRVEVTIEEINE